MALLACAGLLVCGEVGAQARGAVFTRTEKDPLAERAAMLVKLDTWLRRLAGRFRISEFSQPVGEVDCVGIGAGPGVHCIFRFSRSGRDERWGTDVRLFGLDLDAPGVGYLRLNSDSTAEGGVAKLLGDAITFRGDCPIIQPPRWGMVVLTMTACRQELRIHASPDGKSIRMRNRITQRHTVSGLGRSSRIEVPITAEWLLERVSTGTERRK